MMKGAIFIKACILLCLVTLISCNRKASESGESKDQVQVAPQAAPNQTNNSIEVYRNPDPEAKNPSEIRRYPFVSDPDTVVHLVKTACYGECPVFTATIIANGEVRYHGKQNVERMGFYKSRIHKRVIQEIDQKLMAMEFYQLEDRFPQDPEDVILDAPWTYLFSEYKKKRNYIAINHGAPQELTNLINFVERELEILEWQRNVKND